MKLEIPPHGILIARATLQVSIKPHLHLQDLADVAHSQRLSLVNSKCLSCPHSVLDLATVELVPSELIVIILSEGHEIDILQDTNALDENLEYGLLRLAVKVIVSESNMNSRLESIVEGLDAIRRQEQNALKVLKLAEEDADKSVPVDVMHVSLLQEDVRLIEKEDGAPGMADVKNLLQLLLEEA